MKKEKIIGICKLCLQNKELCFSHIIPELFYRYIYDENSRAIEIGVAPYKVSPIQKGHREYMLCYDCEKKIGVFEDYVAKLWHNSFPQEIGGKMFTMADIDYTKFRLFHLSVLWRASVAVQEMYRYVKLGPHEEIIRQMLIKEDPGLPDQYSFIPAIQYMDNKIIHTIVEPVSDKKDGYTFYKFYFGGVVWHYIIGSHSTKNFGNGNYPFFSYDGKLYFPIESILENRDIIRIAKIANEKDPILA